jgi:hypothetical protein
MAFNNAKNRHKIQNQLEIQNFTKFIFVYLRKLTVTPKLICYFYKKKLLQSIMIREKVIH